MNQLFLFRKNMTPIRKLLLMKMFAGGVPISEYTATGNPLTFNTNVVKPLKSLVLPWTPVQSGTGDPSPQNVRSISGVSVLNVWQNDSVNQWDEQWEVGAYNAVGNPVTGSNQIRSKYLIHVEPETEYYFYIGVNVNCRIYFCSENGSVLSYQSQGKGTFTTPVNCKLLKFHTGSGYGETYGSNISINKPSTDTDYHAHAPSVSVTFPDEVGTVYGGSLDVVSGVLTVTHVAYTFTGSEQLGLGSYSGTGGVRINSTALDSFGLAYNIAISDKAIKYASVPTSISALGFRIGSGSSVCSFFIPDDLIEGEITAEKFGEWLASNNLTICSQLSTAQTIQLSATQISALLGDNVIWSDTNGTNTAVYLKKG